MRQKGRIQNEMTASNLTNIVGWIWDRHCSTIQKEKGGRGRVRGKLEGPREYWEKGQVLWICRGVGVVTSRVIRNEYRI